MLVAPIAATDHIANTNQHQTHNQEGIYNHGQNVKLRPLDDRVVVEPRRSRRDAPPAASCCPTPPRKSRSAARSSPSAPASCSTTATAATLSVAIGDEVIYGKYSGTDIEVDGNDVKILRESDILAKVAELTIAAERWHMRSPGFAPIAA